MRPSLARAACGALAVVALARPAAATAQYFPPDDELETMLRYLVEDGETPGIVLGLLEADGTTRVVAHGSGGPGAPPLGPRSVFEIGSVTKTFTGILLADMVARGEVGLDDPVERYLPEGVTVPSLGGREITLLHLATHTSGLPPLPDDYTPPDMRDPYADYSVEMLYAFLGGHRLRREPGAEAEYSNLGMGLLGHALARAAGTPLRRLVRERLLQPLGMETTGYELEDQAARWMTRGHRAGGPVAYWTGTEAVDGAGGLRSNARDMLAYLAANAGPPRTDLERAMRAAHEGRAPLGEGTEVGLGWHRVVERGQTLVSHGGGTGGFRTRVAFDPQRGVGTVVLTNSGDFDDDLGSDLIALGPAPRLPARSPDPQALEALAGRYAGAGDRVVHVRLEDEGWLTAQRPGAVRFRLHALSDSSFFGLREAWTVTFRRAPSGAGVALLVDVHGSEAVYEKADDDVPHPPEVAADPGGAGLLERLRRRGRVLLASWGRAPALLALGLLLALGAGALRVVRLRR